MVDPGALGWLRSQAPEFEVTLVRQTQVRMRVQAASSADAMVVLGDRIRAGQLDGVEVQELGLVDGHVHRVQP